jgi:hypothetical protein
MRGETLLKGHDELAKSVCLNFCIVIVSKLTTSFVVSISATTLVEKLVVLATGI